MLTRALMGWIEFVWLGLALSDSRGSHKAFCCCNMKGLVRALFVLCASLVQPCSGADLVQEAASLPVLMWSVLHDKHHFRYLKFPGCERTVRVSSRSKTSKDFPIDR